MYNISSKGNNFKNMKHLLNFLIPNLEIKFVPLQNNFSFLVNVIIGYMTENSH